MENKLEIINKSKQRKKAKRLFLYLMMVLIISLLVSIAITFYAIGKISNRCCGVITDYSNVCEERK